VVRLVSCGSVWTTRLSLVVVPEEYFEAGVHGLQRAVVDPARVAPSRSLRRMTRATTDATASGFTLRAIEPCTWTQVI
jgi:hypothetical protein